ncbi:MAG: DUF1116 domain-containing protein [Candidatus Rokubacteria bacterium]|nr:DUF1116 domain-containing protein [Candidatus Rokubacteria bacterium]MBI3825762.1 DUF1116 domain-containing protein [Candidatus Rokubacteria bacterium]
MTIGEANREALRRVQASTARLTGVALARDVVPGAGDHVVLHAGPPITWERMCGPQRGAVIGACLFEGWAKSADDAIGLAASGALGFDPCHHHRAVGPMAGIVTPSMAVFVVENAAFGTVAHATIHMGLGRVLRMGAYDESVLEKLDFMNRRLAPLLDAAIRRAGGVDLKSTSAQALGMGDEVHNRNKAATALLIRALAPHVAAAGGPDVERAFDFMTTNESFYLPLSMAAAKAALDAAASIAGSTMVTAMARNGTDVGIRVSGTGDRWFTAPAPRVRGVYFPGFGPDDANPDMGDSAITETAGLGAFAMAAAPAIVQFVGGSADLALQTTLDMYEITLGEHEAYKIPALDFRGTPVGIDVRKVVETGITPAINTGIAHKEPGVGQIGAGLTNMAMECFVQAVEYLGGGLRELGGGLRPPSETFPQQQDAPAKPALERGP